MYVSILGSCTSPVFHTIMELCDTYFTVFVSTFTLMGIYVRVCVCVCVCGAELHTYYLNNVFRCVLGFLYIFVIGYVAVRKFMQFH